MKIDDYIQYWAHMLDEAMDDKTGFIHGNFMFFWGCGPKTRIQKGCLSQWWPCSFEIDGIRYNCAEQYMMAEKARVFGDREMLDAILKTSNPKDIKAYGRAVRGFDPLKWNGVKYDAVVRGNLAKFSQNQELKKFLLSTGDAELVEASPKDRIWGIGLAEDDPRALDKSKWCG